MFDLLSTLNESGELSSNLAIQDDPKYGVIVKGITNVICANEEEALGLLFEGETNKTISEHKLNK